MGLQVEVKNIYNGFLPLTETVIYVVPVGSKLIIKSIVITNLANQIFTIAVKIKKVDSVVISPTKILPLNTITIDTTHTLDEGDQLTVIGDGQSLVTCKVDGVKEDVP